MRALKYNGAPSQSREGEDRLQGGIGPSQVSPRLISRWSQGAFDASLPASPFACMPIAALHSQHSLSLECQRNWSVWLSRGTPSMDGPNLRDRVDCVSRPTSQMLVRWAHIRPGWPQNRTRRPGNGPTITSQEPQADWIDRLYSGVAHMVCPAHSVPMPPLIATTRVSSPLLSLGNGTGRPVSDPLLWKWLGLRIRGASRLILRSIGFRCY